MSLTEWEINGLSLPLDLEDLETIKRYEDAFQKMKKEEIRIPKIGLASDRITANLALYRHLFDNMFGEGTAEHIFANIPLNAREYKNIYFDFLEFIKKQKEESAKRYAEKIKQYLPKNRSQRRQNQKLHKK